MGLPVIRSGRLFFGGLCGHPVTWELGEKRGSGESVSTFPIAAWCTNFENPQSFDTTHPLDSVNSDDLMQL